MNATDRANNRAINDILAQTEDAPKGQGSLTEAHHVASPLAGDDSDHVPPAGLPNLETTTCHVCHGKSAKPPHSAACDTCGGSGRVEVVRVGFIVAHVPTLIAEPCVCGRHRSTTDRNAIEQARCGEEMPAACSCGRVVVVQRRLVETAKPRLVR